MDILKYFFKQTRIFLLIILFYGDKCATTKDAVRDRNISNVSVLEARFPSITEQPSSDSDTTTVYDASLSIGDETQDNDYSEVFSASPLYKTTVMKEYSSVPEQAQDNSSGEECLVSPLSNTTIVTDRHSSALERAQDNSSTQQTNSSDYTFLNDAELFKMRSRIDSYVSNKLGGTSGCYLLNELEVFARIDLHHLLKVLLNKVKNKKETSKITQLFENIKSLLIIVPEQIKTWDNILKYDLDNMKLSLNNIQSITPDILFRLKVFYIIRSDDTNRAAKEISNLDFKGLRKLLKEYLLSDNNQLDLQDDQFKSNMQSPLELKNVSPELTDILSTLDESYTTFLRIQKYHSKLNYMNNIFGIIFDAQEIPDNVTNYSQLSVNERNDVILNYQNLHNNSKQIQDLIRTNNQLLTKLEKLLNKELPNKDYIWVIENIREDLSLFAEHMYYDNIRFHPGLRKVAMRFNYFTNKKYFSLLWDKLKKFDIFEDNFLKYPDNIKWVYYQVPNTPLEDEEYKESYKEKEFIAIQYINTVSDVFIGSPVWQFDEIGKALRRFSDHQSCFEKIVEQTCCFLRSPKELCKIFTAPSKIPFSNEYPPYTDSEGFIHWKCENEELLKNKFKKEIKQMDINSAENCLRLILNNIDFLFAGEYFTWRTRIFELADRLYYYLFHENEELLFSFIPDPPKYKKILFEL